MNIIYWIEWLVKDWIGNSQDTEVDVGDESWKKSVNVRLFGRVGRSFVHPTLYSGIEIELDGVSSTLFRLHTHPCIQCDFLLSDFFFFVCFYSFSEWDKKQKIVEYSRSDSISHSAMFFGYESIRFGFIRLSFDSYFSLCQSTWFQFICGAIKWKYDSCYSSVVIRRMEFSLFSSLENNQEQRARHSLLIFILFSLFARQCD